MQGALITYLNKVKATAIRSKKQTWYAIRQDEADATQENMTPASSYVLKKWVVGLTSEPSKDSFGKT